MIPVQKLFLLGKEWNNILVNSKSYVVNALEISSLEFDHVPMRIHMRVCLLC